MERHERALLQKELVVLTFLTVVSVIFGLDEVPLPLVSIGFMTHLETRTG